MLGETLAAPETMQRFLVSHKLKKQLKPVKSIKT